jgi:HlyD family secretion protein
MTDADKLPLEIGTADPPPARRWFRKRYLFVFLVPVLMFTGGVLGMYFQPPALQKFYALTGLQPGAGSRSPIALPPEIDLPPKMAETLLPSDVVGLARVMPRGDVSIVAAPYGAGDARLAEVLVAVGDTVAKGTPLARLDNRAALESAVLAAEASLAIKEAALLQTRAAVQASRDEAQAALDQAISAAAEAASSLARNEELFLRKVTTEATLDQVRAASAAADLAVARAEATLTRFATLALEDQPDVLVAARNRDAATTELARAKLDLERSIVVAPIAGTILDIHATPGQRPPAGGIMDMGDTSQMMAEVEVWQDRIATVAPGQPVELAAVALGQTLHGVVDSIGLTVGRQGLISDDAAENKDARVIRVLVALDEASSTIAARYTNLEVIARIDTTAAQRTAP